MWGCGVRKVIPEKMVELWTAHAIIAELGASARMWAPTRGFDQTAAPVRGKRFVLELKAPKWETSQNQPSGFPGPQPGPAGAVPVEVDIGQLLEYVDTVDLEVIYVLPQPLHYGLRHRRRTRVAAPRAGTRPWRRQR